MSDKPTTKPASDLLVSEEKRLQIMHMVKDGKISPNKAMDKVLALDKKMVKELKREEQEKEQQLARMTPKARNKEMKLREYNKAKVGEERATMVISPTSYITSPVVVQDLKAEEMTISDADRMAIMCLVKDGTMTVNQAMMRVRMKEQRAAELRLQLPSLATGPQDPTEADGSVDGASMPSDPQRSATFVNKPRSMKKARLSDALPEILETWAPEEYDRTHPEDYDPDVARSCWDMEKEEEQERQLLERWSLIEVDGVECFERIEYFKTKTLRATMEAAAEKEAAARRKAARAKKTQFQTKTDWGKKLGANANGGGAAKAAAPPPFPAAEDLPPAFSDDDDDDDTAAAVAAGPGEREPPAFPAAEAPPPAFSDDDDDDVVATTATTELPDAVEAVQPPVADPGGSASMLGAAAEPVADGAHPGPVAPAAAAADGDAAAAMEQLQLNASAAEAKVAMLRETRARAESAAINVLTAGSNFVESENESCMDESMTEDVPITIETEMEHIRQQARESAMRRLQMDSSSDGNGNTTMELTLPDSSTNDDEV